MELASTALGEALAAAAGRAAGRVRLCRLRRCRAGASGRVDPGGVEARAEADLALGRHGELVGELEALCREHPLRERLWELLILALYRAGRQAEALRAYTEVRDRLVDELGIDPARPCENSRPASWPRTRRSPRPAAQPAPGPAAAPR